MTISKKSATSPGHKNILNHLLDYPKTTIGILLILASLSIGLVLAAKVSVDIALMLWNLIASLPWMWIGLAGLIIGAVIALWKNPTWRVRVSFKPLYWPLGICICVFGLIWFVNRQREVRQKEQQARVAAEAAAKTTRAHELEHPLFVVKVDSLHCVDTTFNISLSEKLTGILIIPWNYRVGYFWPVGSTLPFAVHVEGYRDTEYWPGDGPKDTPHSGQIQLRALGGRVGDIGVRVFPLNPCRKTKPPAVQSHNAQPPVQNVRAAFLIS
jgi:hypothetical protein